jgi:hypothetical protein
MEGAPEMVFTCKKHVKEALKIIDLPHIYPISENDRMNCQYANCRICGNKAEFKLFNYLPQRKTKQAI